MYFSISGFPVWSESFLTRNVAFRKVRKELFSTVECVGNCFLEISHRGHKYKYDSSTQICNTYSLSTPTQQTSGKIFTNTRVQDILQHTYHHVRPTLSPCLKGYKKLKVVEKNLIPTHVVSLFVFSTCFSFLWDV